MGTLAGVRVAVITDIHANLPALEAVLEAAEAAGTEEVWCLGDVVGYGVEPDACADLVRERCDTCLVGNHDLAVLGALDIGSFSEAAAVAVEWTRDNVHERTLEFLRELEPRGERSGIGLFHASPRDPVWEYVLSREQAGASMDSHPSRIGLIGHSHVALFFNRADGSRGETRGGQASDGALLDLGRGKLLVNPGSVGQPRDGDPRAAWLELDTEAEAARFHRVPYEIERAAAPIAAAGLPRRLADRLHAGQ
jgi:diadenosine tetraphosphatase ApaH/serine/threonine PP2A family protein phosphatase